jgi:hypothetical protein
MLVQLLRGAGATIVFAIPDRDSTSLLKVHGVILDMDKVFCVLEDALEWCEEQVLFRHITARSSSVRTYQEEENNYAFSPRPTKKRGSSTGGAARVIGQVHDDNDEFEDRTLKPTASFDTRYLASAWNDRHASPTDKHKQLCAGRGKSFRDSEDEMFPSNVFGMNAVVDLWELRLCCFVFRRSSFKNA